MRVMAIDYGDARTGIAISDALGTICGTAFTLALRDPEQLAERIAAECSGRGVAALVLGLPKNMDGSEGERAKHTREFARLLTEHTGLEPVLWDERRTTVEAHAILHANGKRAIHHKKNVDAVAAALILEAYLGTLPVA